MPYDPHRHHRRSIRYRGYDYAQSGAYFITICTHERGRLVGEVGDGVMQCNDYGEIVREEWFKTQDIRPNVRLYEDEWVVMPNHVHGIIWIVDDGGDERRGDPLVAPTTPTGPPPDSIGAIMAGFKSTATKRINAMRQSPGAPVWQRNYYDRIIRNDHALNAIRQYIIDNPARWKMDCYNPDADGPDPRVRDILRIL